MNALFVIWKIINLVTSKVLLDKVLIRTDNTVILVSSFNRIKELNLIVKKFKL
jgi:hypothetical protein